MLVINLFRKTRLPAFTGAAALAALSVLASCSDNNNGSSGSSSSSGGSSSGTSSSSGSSSGASSSSGSSSGTSSSSGSSSGGALVGVAKTPIKHVILIIGENRTFDHVFGTYTPPAGQTISNLLSKGIVNADGTPGPNFSQAQQYTATTGLTYSNSPTKGAL